MGKLEEAKFFLEQIGMPKKQQSDICGYTLLAMADIAPRSEWGSATNEWIRIHDVIQFTERHYNVTYAENSRETFRKQAMHPFRNAAIIEDNGMATNSPNYRYRITDEALGLIRRMGTYSWNRALERFLAYHKTLAETYASKKEMSMVPIRVGEREISFSSGRHNELQKAIVEEFAPRFAPGSECLYIGDTTNRDLIKEKGRLRELGFEITLHDKMPDVVLYKKDRDWLYFIEAVTSVGPMSPERIIDINAMTSGVTAGKIFVTAFLDFRTYKKFSNEIAWDTEDWIMTTDFYVTEADGRHHAYAVKPSRDLDGRTLQKLCIEMLYWESRHVPFTILFKEDANRTLAANIRIVTEFYDPQLVLTPLDAGKHMIATKQFAADLEHEAVDAAYLKRVLMENSKGGLITCQTQ